jgi:hypothetical protein
MAKRAKWCVDDMLVAVQYASDNHHIYFFLNLLRRSRATPTGPHIIIHHIAMGCVKSMLVEVNVYKSLARSYSRGVASD